jgi:DNA processing protein
VTLDTAWVALSLLPSVGNKTLAALTEAFGNFYDVLAADTDALMAVRGVGQKIAAAIRAINLSELEQDIAIWQTAGVQIVPQHASNYPKILLTIPDPPLTLFIRGDHALQTWNQTVAIVGTRNPSPVAADLAKQLAMKLAENGWTIVSGLALGIDTMGHEGALNHPNGKTLAVLGSGVLNVYPPQNQTLVERILANGILLSENHPYATAKAARLVTRNRIISGFCQHVVVVESAINGGAMHAARATLKQGRKLYSFDLPASGNQSLLENGANCINTDLSGFPL